LKEKQERRGEIKREKENRKRSSETGAKIEYAITTSVAEKANASSAGNNRACSDGRDQKDEYSSSERFRAEDGGSSKKRPLCYGNRQREKLLCLWGFWAHGPPL